MITFEEFQTLIKEYNEQEERINILGSIFTDVYASPLIEYGELLFDKLIHIYFNEEGVDWIYYYLFENPDKEVFIDSNPISLETITDLWNLIKECRI